MKATLFILLIATLAAAGTNRAVADQLSNSRRPVGDNPNPVLSGGQQARPAPPAPPAPPPPPKRPPDRADRDGSRHDGGRINVPSNGYYYPYGRWAYGYDPYYTYGYPYPYYAPYYASPDELYGPQAMRRFMGADDGAPPQPNVNVAPPRRDAAQGDAPEPKKGVERATNAQSNALAWKFIGFGDTQFAQQKFVDANVRYRKAAQAAPQLADAWFRQGFALSALGRYDQAVVAIKRGLRLNPNWAKSEFDLKELYGADKRQREAQLATLARAADDKPNNANLLFVLGVYLHFDGQTKAAQKLFERAKELIGGDDEHIRAFLAK